MFRDMIGALVYVVTGIDPPNTLEITISRDITRTLLFGMHTFAGMSIWRAMWKSFRLVLALQSLCSMKQSSLSACTLIWHLNIRVFTLAPTAVCFLAKRRPRDHTLERYHCDGSIASISLPLRMPQLLGGYLAFFWVVNEQESSN